MKYEPANVKHVVAPAAACESLARFRTFLLLFLDGPSILSGFSFIDLKRMVSKQQIVGVAQNWRCKTRSQKGLCGPPDTQKVVQATESPLLARRHGYLRGAAHHLHVCVGEAVDYCERFVLGF